MGKPWGEHFPFRAHRIPLINAHPGTRMQIRNDNTHRKTENRQYAEDRYKVLGVDEKKWILDFGFAC